MDIWQHHQTHANTRRQLVSQGDMEYLSRNIGAYKYYQWIWKYHTWHLCKGQWDPQHPQCEWKMCLIKTYGNFIRMSSGQTSLLLQIQLRGYKSLDPTMKHQKAIPENLVLHIYKRTNTHLTTSIDQLVAGECFFGMQSCKYWTTPKGEDKCTRIFEKRDISFL